MNARFVSLTPDAEKTIAYIARVSNPKGQQKSEISKLLKYCIRNNHWSIFEQATMTIEVETTRAISAQILRHRSFKFQEFSQRYESVNSLDESNIPDLRRQDIKNRQNSIDTIPNKITQKYRDRIEKLFSEINSLYKDMLNDDIAKECARMILPMCSPTKIYITGDIRSWMHYIQLRSSNGTQLEHMKIAEECKKIFIEKLPIISLALDWK